MESLLFFKSYQSGTFVRPGGDRTWIHPSGRMSAIIDGVTGCRDAHTAAERCLNFLKDMDENLLSTLPLQEILEKMHSDLLGVDSGLMCVAALIRYENDLVNVAWVGNPRLYSVNEETIESLLGPPQIQPLKVLGMPEGFCIEQQEIQMDSRSTYILCSDGLDHEKLIISIDQIKDARNDAEWLYLGENVSREEDWAFLIFPVERSISYMNPEWPYNPFVGPQEEYTHEKIGLADIATELFKQPDFAGFKIVGNITITRANSTRRPDGVLVCPYGVVLLELKDHNTNLELYAGKYSPMQVDMKNNKFRPEPNPIGKMTDMLPSFGNYKLTDHPMEPLKTELRKIGAIVFTNPRVNVTCISGTGLKSSLPHKAGDVLVVTTKQLPATLRNFTQKLMNNKGPFLDNDTINSICSNLVIQFEHTADTTYSILELGKFVIDSQPILDESTPYYKVFHGRFKDRDKRVIVKQFTLNSMGRDTADQEIERLGREAYALNNLLVRTRGVQHCHGSIKGTDSLYIILEDVDGPKLSEWLDSNPGRTERIHLLNSLALILEELANENIVHRAFYPSNIRVKKSSADPILTNFELCQLADIATLPMLGRRLLDSKFIAAETNTAGATITPASDVYSFAKIACYVLSQDRSLPFSTYMEQADFVRKKGAWENLSNSLGLPLEAVQQLKCMLSNSIEKRPVGKDLVDIVRGWQ